MPGQRQLIVSAVKARLAAITVANGYQTDIGSKQTEWRMTPKDAGDRPGHDVRDPVEQTVVGEGERNRGLYERRLQVEVVVETNEDSETAANSRKALEDLIKAVAVDPTWGGLAKYTLPVEDSVAVDDEGQNIGGARLVMEIVYFRKPWAA